MANIVFGLNYKLFQLSHEVLDCLFALLKGEETFVGIVPDVWWLESLFELISKLVEGVHCI